MQSILISPVKSLIAGLVISAIVLALWLGIAGADRVGLASFVLRWLHVLTSIVWVGLIWFVNFIQLAAVREANDAERAAIHKLIVPRVAVTFRHASHAVMLSGILLLVTSGYLLDRLMFTSAVYIPPLRNWLLWGGTIAGTAMWAFVHFKIWPAIRLVLAEPAADAAAIAAARDTVRTYARLNLILAIPVTFVMVAAAHLY
ncbi:MAG: hypothetical protein ABL904_26835 [Hyphomicrobiaceae bacterium]